VLVPVVGRPQNAAPLAESLRAARNDAVVQLAWIYTLEDSVQLDACIAAGYDWLIPAPWPRGTRGDYARKINLGLWSTPTPYLLAGADDLRFHDGWADEAIAVAEAHDAGFVGTNDLANPQVKKGLHATHPLVRRDYALECGTIDTPGLIYTELYWHQWVDTEAVGTAKHRGCWAFAGDSHVEHLHPIWGTALGDDVYDLGQAHTAEDRALFATRRPLWGGL
jgi:hypothetical protein